MTQRTLPVAVARLEMTMEINDFNELGRESLAGSCRRLRERVRNLREDWHTVDTGPFAARSGRSA